MSLVQVIGGGYVGLTTAASFCHLGHEVEVVELDPARRSKISSGSAPFFEPGLEALLEAGIRAKRLRVSSPDTAEYQSAEFVFLCLPTPDLPDGSADLSALYEAVAIAAPRLSAGTVVVSKSTVPVGTARQLEALLARSDIALVSNPEFLQEGAAVSAFLNAERVVIGADDAEAANRVAALYAGIEGRVVVTSVESAELAKHACNAFLATKLSFVNSIAALCELNGADISEVTEVMGSDSRIGPKFLNPGPGWGGSCFPKDSASLLHDARRAGFDFQLLQATIAANEQSFDRVVERISDSCGGDLKGRTVAVWGLAFKAGTADVRHSPALAVIARLHAAGASVVAFDPMVSRIEGVTVAEDEYAACAGAHALTVLTEWPQFQWADLGRVAEIMAARVVVDTRGIIDVDRATHAGLQVWSVGRAHHGGTPDASSVRS